MSKGQSRPPGRHQSEDVEFVTIRWRRRQNKDRASIWKKIAIGVITSVLSAILLWIGKTALELLIAMLPSHVHSIQLAANHIATLFM